MSNTFHPFENLPKKEDLDNLVNNFEYVKLSAINAPSEILNSGLSKKMNSYILASSGTTSGTCYSFIGLRPDKGNSVIDEHPFLFYYDHNNPAKNFGGILDHGNWPDRTIDLEPWQMDCINLSGLTYEFNYKGIPPDTSGTLEDLDKKGMLVGLSEQFKILLNNKKML